MSGIWDDAEVISAYTREQALEDGTLRRALDLVPDEPGFCEQAGFRAPVALTARVAALVEPNEAERAYGQDVKGRLWDLLMMARLYRKPRPMPQAGATWQFPVIFYCSGRDTAGSKRSEMSEEHRTFNLSCSLAPGDHYEPVVTIMFPEED